MLVKVWTKERSGDAPNCGGRQIGLYKISARPDLLGRRDNILKVARGQPWPIFYSPPFYQKRGYCVDTRKHFFLFGVSRVQWPFHNPGKQGIILFYNMTCTAVDCLI